MKKIMLTMLILALFFLVLSVQEASAWYTDCNVSNTENIGFSSGRDPLQVDTNNCGLVLLRVKATGMDVDGVDFLKGNYDEAVSESERQKGKQVEIGKER